MRISVDPRDEAYDPKKVFGAVVFLDGQELKGCITADEEKGVAVVYVRNAKGVYTEDPNDPDSFLRETKTGKVEIKLS